MAAAAPLRSVPGPSLTPEADQVQADCRTWTDLHAMIARLEEQAAELRDRIVEAAGAADVIEFTDSSGEARTMKVVRVPIRTISRDMLEQSLPKTVYRSLLAEPTLDTEKVAAAVKLGQIDPVILAEATTVTYRRPYLRPNAVKR